MKTKTIELYQFDELSKEVKAKVVDRERYINTEGGFWYKYPLEEWNDKLSELGFIDANISFTGFYSQGDGASFVCKSVDVPLFLAKQKAKGQYKSFLRAIEKGKVEVNAEIHRIDHHYSHEYTVKAEVEVSPDEEGYTNFFNDGNRLQELLTSVVRTLSKQIYRELETEYEGLTSDEAVVDTIKANEYYFTASGRMEESYEPDEADDD